MLFTYTDKDGYVPPSEIDNRLTTGDGGAVCSPLQEAVANMPRNAASCSSVPRGGGGAAGGGGGGGPKGLGNTSLSETAAVMQTHLLREDKFKVSSSTLPETVMTMVVMVMSSGNSLNGAVMIVVVEVVIVVVSAMSIAWR